MLSYDNAAAQTKGVRDEQQRRGERVDTTSPVPTWVFFPASSFSVTWCFCFSQLPVHADRTVIFIAKTAPN